MRRNEVIELKRSNMQVLHCERTRCAVRLRDNDKEGYKFFAYKAMYILIRRLSPFRADIDGRSMRSFTMRTQQRATSLALEKKRPVDKIPECTALNRHDIFIRMDKSREIF